jgi:protein TonB
MSKNLEQARDSLQVPERRLHSRWPPRSLVYVELGGDNGGVVLNIIENGMAVRAAQTLHGDLLPRIRFRLPRSQNWIETSGQIVWVGKSEKEIGIRFIELPEAARNQIKHWIASEALSGGFHEEIGTARDEQVQPISEPANFDSAGWAPRSLMPDAGAESRRRYKISSAIAAAALESAKSAAVSPPPAALRPNAARIATPETVTAKQIPFTAALVSEKRAPLSSVSAPSASPASSLTPKLAQDSPLNLTGYSADGGIDSGAQRRSWVALAALGSLVIVVSFGAGIAVGGRSLGGVIGFFQRLTQDRSASAQGSMPNSGQDSTPASPVESSQPGEAPQDSAPNVPAQPSAPSVHPTEDSGLPPAHMTAKDSHAARRDAQESRTPVSAKENKAASPLSVSNDISSAVSQSQISQPTATTTPQQENLPAVSSPRKDLEGATGSVAVTSHFRSIRVPPALRSQISRLGNTLQIGELISSNQPPYPVEALQQRIEGTVRLHAVIGQDGTIQSVEPVSGPPPLVSAAMSAVRGWRYKQTLLGGQPIERDEDITLVFRLKN